MATNALTPHNFILWLRVERPELARLTECFRSLSLQGGELAVRAPSLGWPGGELWERSGELEKAAAVFFGGGCTLSLSETARDPEALPSPVMAGKVGNHVAFWARGMRRDAALVAKKPDLARALAAGAALAPENGGDYGAEFWEIESLPSLLERLLEKMRDEFSYVHIVTPFPGHAEAKNLEYSLYAAKEWGTPRSPAPLLQRFVGRLHYCDPDSPPLGMRAVADFLAGLG